jgi:hypothetical protein
MWKQYTNNSHYIPVNSAYAHDGCHHCCHHHLVVILSSLGEDSLVNSLQPNGTKHQLGEYACHFKTFLRRQQKANDRKQHTLSSCYAMLSFQGKDSCFLDNFLHSNETMHQQGEYICVISKHLCVGSRKRTYLCHLVVVTVARILDSRSIVCKQTERQQGEYCSLRLRASHFETSLCRQQKQAKNVSTVDSTYAL